MMGIAASPTIVKLRHQYAGPSLATWDYLSKGCGFSICHYQTLDYYPAGYQYWYVWADQKVLGDVLLFDHHQAGGINKFRKLVDLP
jgi:hypothetical protein